MKTGATEAIEREDLSPRTAQLLDEARAALAAVMALEGVESGSRDAARRAADGLEWAGQWLDTPYSPICLPSPPLDGAADAVRMLRGRADAFEGWIEALEEADPLANADGIQTSSLAFAIVGATASLIERRSAASTVGERTGA